MAKPTESGKNKSARDLLAQLERLPRRSDLVIEGGKMPLALYVRDGDQIFQPYIALWVESASGYVRTCITINPLESEDEGFRLTLGALVASFTGPFVNNGIDAPRDLRNRSGQNQRLAPALPAKVVVNDRNLLEGARLFLDPLGIPVEYQEAPPAFTTAYEELSLMMGADENGPPEPFVWTVDPVLLPPLYKVAASYWRRAPWNYMPDHPPIMIELGKYGPQAGVHTLYASILGAGGMVLGVAFYYSLEDYQNALDQGKVQSSRDEKIEVVLEQMRASGVSLEGIPARMLYSIVGRLLGDEVEEEEEEENIAAIQDSLFFSFDTREDCDPGYLKWLDEHHLKYASASAVPSFFRILKGENVRKPDAQETLAFIIAIEALNQFLSRFHEFLETGFIPTAGLVFTARIKNLPPVFALSDQATIVLVRFPTPGYSFKEEADRDVEVDMTRPASITGITTLYSFKVHYLEKPSERCDIEMRGDQTLHDLHIALMNAFALPETPLYDFFLSAMAGATATQYHSPPGEGRYPGHYRLEHLPLQQGQHFLYSAFADAKKYEAVVAKIEVGGVEKGIRYPRIL